MKTSSIVQQFRESAGLVSRLHTRDSAIAEAQKYPGSLYGKGPKPGPSKAAMDPGAWYKHKSEGLIFKAVAHTKKGSMAGVMRNSQGRAVKTTILDVDVRQWVKVSESDVDADARNDIDDKIGA